MLRARRRPKNSLTYLSVRDTTPVRLSLTTTVSSVMPAPGLHGTRVSCLACIRMHVFVLERCLQAKYSCYRRRDSEQILNVSFVAAGSRPSRQSG